jgi:hypothetical protein
MTQRATQNRLIADHEDDGIEENEDTPARPRVKPSATRNPRRREGRGSYPGRRQVTGYVSDQLFLYLKSISAQDDKAMIEIMEEALTAYVNSWAAQKKFGPE